MSSREELFRQRRERARLEARVGQAIQSGDPRVFPSDRFGAPVTPGSHILFRPTYDFVYEVLDVKPVLDPNAPPGMINLVLASETTITIPAGTPLMNMVRLLAGPEASTSEPVPSAQGDGDPGHEEEPPAGPRLVLTDTH